MCVLYARMRDFFEQLGVAALVWMSAQSPGEGVSIGSDRTVARTFSDRPSSDQRLRRRRGRPRDRRISCGE
jgi:hypothetical protein